MGLFSELRKRFLVQALLMSPLVCHNEPSGLQELSCRDFTPAPINTTLLLRWVVESL